VVDDHYHLKGLITVKDIQKKLKYPYSAKDEQGRLRVGAAIGATTDFLERAQELVARKVDVLGIDIAANLVEAGNARAQGLGLANITFQEGDASDLNELEDNSFALVVSVFGAMFAPKPFDVAKEMVRVTKSGGRVVMGNWIANDPTLVAQILKVSSAYSPPPPEGFVSPMTWGVETHVRERFAAAGVPGAAVRCTPDTFTFDFAGTPEQFVETFRNFYGPTMNAFDAAAKNGRAEALQRELEELFRAQNKSGNAARTVIPATYLRVTATVA